AVRPRTYGNLLYLWLGLPLGLAYFIGLTVGISAGVPLTIVWVGLAILLVTFLAAWGAAGFERQLAIHLLGAHVPERVTHPKSARLLSRLGALLSSAALWKGMAFLFFKFPVALTTWVISLVSLVVPLAFACIPIAWLVDPSGFDIGIGYWQPESFLGTLPFGIAGVLGLLVALHLQNGMGWMWARLAEWMLGSTAPTSPAALGANRAAGDPAALVDLEPAESTPAA
ncbi:MAG: sensor domain-containing protein, partial [Thermoanaerobaculia bacterium]